MILLQAGPDYHIGCSLGSIKLGGSPAWGALLKDFQINKKKLNEYDILIFCIAE